MELGIIPLVDIAVLLIALFLRPIAQKTILSYPVLLILIGFFVSEIIVSLGYDTGIRAENFKTIVMYLILPTLIFQIAYGLKVKLFVKDLPTILYLSLPATILTFVITAVILYYGINHPTGFPWMAALLTGALLSFTCTFAVSDILQQYKNTEAISDILSGESLLGGVLGILLFILLLEVALMPDTSNIDLKFWIVEFIGLLGGGVLVAIMVGGIAIGLININRDPMLQTFVTIAAVYFSYILAVDILHVSGVVAVASVGIIFGNLSKELENPETYTFLSKFWDMARLLGYTTIFLLMGVTITFAMFKEQWLAMLLGIIAVVIARAIGVYVVLPLAAKCKLDCKRHWGEYHDIFLGGTRGALALAFALAIPVELSYWWTVQSIIFGVVIFTMLIQIPVINVMKR